MDDNRKYRGMDPYLEKINREYISFSDKVVRRNNKILIQVLDPLIDKMKECDILFQQLYSTKFNGGSYYDGLKVRSPDEYDIDLLLKFKSSHGIEVRAGELPGFVHLYLNDKKGFEKFCSVEKWESFLDTNKVLVWMEGVLQKGLNYFRRDNESPAIFGMERTIYVRRFCKGGPAFTLNIAGEFEGYEIEMDVDLVPCISFSGENWPEGFSKYYDEYRNNMSSFFVVPKKPKNAPEHDTKYWRLSFQIQERDLIRDKGRLKPALRLLKKMRDTKDHKQVSSYFLKTVVLWEAQKHDPSFWIKNTLSYIFMHILKKYQECLGDEELLYFWNKDYNFLDTINSITVFNMSNALRRIIKDINRNMPDNPSCIVKYILTPSEKLHLYPELTSTSPIENESEFAYIIKPSPESIEEKCSCVLL